MELQLYRSCEPDPKGESTDAEYEKPDGEDADAEREKPGEGDADAGSEEPDKVDADSDREKTDEGLENNGWEPVGEKFRVTVNG